MKRDRSRKVTEPVSSGCRSKYQTGRLHTDIYVLTALEAKKLRSRCQYGRFRDSSVLGLWMVAFSLYPHKEEERVSALVSLLIRTLILWDQGPTSYDLM